MSYSDSLLFSLGPHRELLLGGLATTLQLSVVSFFGALVLGILVCSIRASPSRLLRAAAAIYVEYHRNTPALVQLFFWYFGISEILPLSLSRWIYQQNAEFIFAAIALSLCMSAYICEDIRSGLRSIPSEQNEASRAIGFSFWQTLSYILLPQAIRIAVPSIISRALLTAKNSSLALAIGVPELIYAARKVQSETFKAFEAFGFVTICYLLITFSIMAFGHWYETHYVKAGQN